MPENPAEPTPYPVPLLTTEDIPEAKRSSQIAEEAGLVVSPFAPDPEHALWFLSQIAADLNATVVVGVRLVPDITAEGVRGWRAYGTAQKMRMRHLLERPLPAPMGRVDPVTGNWV